MRTDIVTMLLDRAGDHRPGLRTRERDWTWDQVVDESAARAALAQTLRGDGPFHIGVLLDNVPDFVFWLGAAALAGATVVGINPTRGAGELREQIAHADCQLIITDAAERDRLADAGIATGPVRAAARWPGIRPHRPARWAGPPAPGWPSSTPRRCATAPPRCSTRTAG